MSSFSFRVDRDNVASAVGAFFVASKEVSLCSPGLNWASINRGLVQGQSECINVGFGGVLDLHEASKGEVVFVVIGLV